MNDMKSDLNIDPQTDASLSERLSSFTETERELIELLVRYGLITKATWQSIFDDPLSVAQYSQAMWSLTRSRWVTAKPLHAGKMCFILSNSMVTRLGLPAERAKPMVHATLFRDYARLLYCTKYESASYRLSKEQVERLIEGTSEGIPLGFWGNDRQSSQFAFMRIDQSRFGSANHAAQAIRKDVHRLIRFDSICKRIKEKQFEWVFVTPTKSRAEAVLKAFRQYEVGKAPVRSVVMDELVPLLKREEIKD